MNEYVLRLYVTGQTSRAARAIANLRQLCEIELQDRFRIDVIDVLEHPELAEAERILATPTLVRQLPPPLRRVIGDLSETSKVLLGLDIWPSAQAGPTDTGPSRDGDGATPLE
jgi:circadian clock protein KaiB